MRRGSGRASALRVALPPWLLAHVLVLGVLALVATFRGPLLPTGDVPDARGLWVWDAGWYRAIAERGYDLGYGEAGEALRFFPLVPLLGRGLAALLHLPVEITLLGLSWAAALAYGALLVRLVRRELGDEGAARRSVWLAMLAPGASVLVLAYTEPVAGALAAGFFLALRRDAPLAALPLGILSGLARPVGLLLVAPALVEALRAARAQPRPPGGRAGWLAAWLPAVASPVVGTAAYCTWVGLRYGDPLLPYTVQSQEGSRGGILGSPLRHLTTTVPGGLGWPLQIAALILAVVLLAVAARRLPPSYAVWSGLFLLAAVTSSVGRSFPRYLAGNFPLLVAAATLSAGGRRWPVTLAACLVASFFLIALGFGPTYVL